MNSSFVSLFVNPVYLDGFWDISGRRSSLVPISILLQSENNFGICWLFLKLTFYDSVKKGQYKSKIT